MQSVKSLVLFSMVSTTLLLSGCNLDGGDKNTPPVAVSIELTTQTDIPISDKLQAEDSNNDMLSYSVMTPPESGTLTLQSDGSFVYTPASEQTGTDSFTYSVSDGVNAAVSATVHINITAQQLAFSSYSRMAFNQSANAMPLPLNGRQFDQDVMLANAYDDLLMDQ